MTAPIKGASAPATKPADRKGIKTDIGETALPGSPPTILSRDQITIDPELQPRAGNNQALVDQYAETLKERNWLPEAPLTLVGSDGERWLVDGHNRFHAAAIAGITEIPARIIPGDYQDAVRYSLGVNADHGLQRSGDDLRLAYQKAVDHQFCAADDAPAVAELLKCSERWARELTREAREQVKSTRNAEIERLAEEGLSQREIAEKTGLAKTVIQEVLSGRKWKASESDHLDGEQGKVERDREIQRLAEEGRTQQEIAATVGVGQATVHRTLDYSKRNPSEVNNSTVDPAPVTTQNGTHSEMGNAVLGAEKRNAFQNSAPSPEPPTTTVDDGPDWGWPEGASVEPPKAAPARPTAPAKAPAPQPPAQVGAKGPTSWDAGQVALKVGRVLSALYQIDSALEYEPDGRALLANLRYAVDHYAAKFADKEGNGHA